LAARRTLEALQGKVEEIRVWEIPDHIDDDVEDIPVEQIIRFECPLLTQKVRRLLESVRQVARPVVPDRLDTGKRIIKGLTEWFVKNARRRRPVERDGDLLEETMVMRQCRRVIETGEHQIVDPFLLKFDVIPISSMRRREMFLLNN
jgi:hypothetical protein